VAPFLGAAKKLGYALSSDAGTKVDPSDAWTSAQRPWWSRPKAGQRQLREGKGLRSAGLKTP